MRIKNVIRFTAVITIMVIAFAGCGSNSGSYITVISREDGSGTRTAVGGNQARMPDGLLKGARTFTENITFKTG